MVQSSGTNEVPSKDDKMPQYMQRSGSRFIFRRAIPQSLRAILGKREFKVALGSDFKEACRLARLQATLSDEQMLNAQGEHQKLQRSRAERLPFFDQLKPLTEVTDELKQQLHAYWIAVVDTSDQDRRANGFDDVEDLEEFRANLLVMRDRLKSDWAAGNVSPYLPALHQTLHLRGYRLEVSDVEERKLALQYLRALMAGYELLINRDQGNDPLVSLPTTPLPSASISSAPSNNKPSAGNSKRLTIIKLFDHWNDPHEKRPLKTIEGVRQHIEDFIKISKKKFADEVQKEDFLAYVQARKELGRSPGTIAKDLSFLSAVWNAASNSGLISINPYKGIKSPKSRRRSTRDLDTEDLKTLLSCSLYKANERPKAGAGEAAVWLPLIAMFSGARLEEIAQLTVNDIRTQAGSHYFDIIDLDDDEEDAPEGGQSLKTESSRRKVPIHAELIKAGFLSYVSHLKEHKQTLLFPEMTPDRYGSRSGNWSKWWSRWRRSIGLSGRGKRFHDLRHLFKTACRDAEISKEIHDGLTGHAPSDVGGQYGEISFNAKVKAINKFSYPDLKIEWIWKVPVQP